MIWANETGLPIISTPPAKTSSVPSWVMTGEASGGISWEPYPSGDFYKVKVSDADPSGDYLGEKLDSVASSIIISDYTNYLNIDIDPDYFISSDESIQIEETELGLDFTISSHLVQVTDEDVPGYLGDKITSENESLLISIESDDENQTLNIEINPEYFYSSDGSVHIAETSGGLDFTISSYLLKVSSTDTTPGYLSDKIASENNSLLTSIESDDGNQTLNIEINPNYFYSSNRSIEINETNNGLDFAISSHLVQVHNGDEPGYLSDKITSENNSLMTSISTDSGGDAVNIEINPNYFYSSSNTISIAEISDELNFNLNTSIFTSRDGTLGINATSGNVDFSVSGLFKVKINQNDGSPGYLANKIIANAPLSIQASDGRLEISLAVPSGTGLLFINNGQLSVIPIGTGVAVGDGSTLTFEEPEECE